MSELDQILTANTEYASSFEHGGLPMPPSRHVAVLTCMDARLDPEAFLGLKPGDAHVIRNAGGRASDDALRSLIISEQLLGTREVIVIHHTDCGMLTFSNDDLHAKLHEGFGEQASHIDFLPFGDLEQSVHDDVAAVRANVFIPESVDISGFIYDVNTGRLERVV